MRVRMIRIEPSRAAVRRVFAVNGGGVLLALAFLQTAAMVRAAAESGRTTAIASFGALAGLALIGAGVLACYLRFSWLEADGGELRISKWGRQRRLGKPEVVGF